jgi:hypothetical protein
MFAIIGIFIFGVVVGLLAITNAGKAEALGVRAPFGRVCGWIVTVLGVSISLVVSALVSVFLLHLLDILTRTYPR